MVALETSMPDPFRQMANLWWLWLITGVAWVVVALVVLQFDQASINTVGVVIGIMFLVAGTQNLVFGTLARGATQWILWIFGVLLLIAGLISLVRPEDTFAGVADILGFIFLMIGVFWLIEAFAERGAQRSLVVRADLGARDGHPGVLDQRSILHREAVRAARLRRGLGPLPRGR